jgi:carbonic anhydrase
MTGQEALTALKEGNQRYVKNELMHPHLDQHRRHELVDGQKPFAVVLSCADSRVVPEFLFDQGLGDLFVIRVAGNVAKDKVIASIEYAVLNLGSKLIIALGHEKCGAVAAAMGDDPLPGHLGILIDNIKPAVHIAKTMKGDTLTNAVKLNARIVAGNIAESQPILAERVKSGELVVVPAYYKLENGEVEFIES